MSEFLSEAIQNQSVPLFFTVALFFAAISGFSLSVRHRVILVYSYCLLMNLLGVVDFATAAVGSTVVLFLILEVFNPDSELVSLFSLRYKLLDFVYRLVCELYGWREGTLRALSSASRTKAPSRCRYCETSGWSLARSS